MRRSWKIPTRSSLIPAMRGLATLIAMLIFGCTMIHDAPDPARVQEQIESYRQQELELVRSTIDDPERAARFIELMNERDELIETSTAAITRYRNRMAELNADYNADRESFEALLFDFQRQREVAQGQFVAIVGRMKAETTAEEWKDIAKFQTKWMNPRELAYRSSSHGG